MRKVKESVGKVNWYLSAGFKEFGLRIPVRWNIQEVFKSNWDLLVCKQ